MRTRPRLTAPRTNMEEMQAFIEARINGGMVTTIDSADIENNQFTRLRNFIVRMDKTTRRAGYTAYEPVAPDANPVLHLAPIVTFSGTVYLARFTRNSVHLGTSSTWNPCTSASPITGTNTDRIRTVVINDRVFFTNNGVNEVQEIDTTGFTYAAAGNAGKYKYICGFYNRLVTANLAGASPNPVYIAWSGDNNFDEFNPLNDISAGFEYLIESPSDYADFITGLFGFANTMLVLRQRSIWLATKQPIASSPFYFYTAVPNIGCDCPNSAVQIPNGIAWLDRRTATVYAYTIGSPTPIPIGRPVERDIIANLSDPEQVFASFDPINNEYSVAIPSGVSSLVKIWTYNFVTQAWWYEEIDNISSIANIDYSGTSLVINELPGTINSLTGTINQLQEDVEVATRFLGMDDGSILISSSTSDTDNGTAFTAEAISKTYYMPSLDMYIAQLRVEYQATKAGTYTVSYSKDAGATFTTYKTVTISAEDIGLRKIAYFTKHLKARNFTWKLSSTSGLFDLLSYEIHVYSGAKSKP